MTKEERLAKYAPAIQEYLNTPEKERSLTKLSDKYGVRRATLTKYLKEMGVDIINQQNRVRINETVFDVIDTEEKAYWLGFLYADGGVSSTDNKVELGLKADDWEHIQKFQQFLGYTEDTIRIAPNYGKKGYQCRFSVRNAHLKQSLIDKGCVPKKSLILKFPNKDIFKSEDLIIHFIRGYCDGDGTLGIYPHGYSLQENLGMLGTEDFLTGVVQALGVPIRVTPKINIFKFLYVGRKARQVADILYTNATIYLNRKKEIADKFCQRAKELALKKSGNIGEGWDANTEISSGITEGSETS